MSSLEEKVAARELFNKMSVDSEKGLACGSFGKHSGPLNWILYGGTICQRHAEIAKAKCLPVEDMVGMK